MTIDSDVRPDVTDVVPASPGWPGLNASLAEADPFVVRGQPPSVADRTHRPFHDQEVGTGGKRADDDVAGADPGGAANQDVIAVSEGRDHRRSTDQDVHPAGTSERSLGRGKRSHAAPGVGFGM